MQYSKRLLVQSTLCFWLPDQTRQARIRLSHKESPSQLLALLAAFERFLPALLQAE